MDFIGCKKIWEKYFQFKQESFSITKIGKKFQENNKKKYTWRTPVLIFLEFFYDAKNISFLMRNNTVSGRHMTATYVWFYLQYNTDKRHMPISIFISKFKFSLKKKKFSLKKNCDWKIEKEDRRNWELPFEDEKIFILWKEVL